VTTTSDWGPGYCASVTVANGGNAPLTWSVTVPIEGTVYSLWNAVYSVAGNLLTAQGVGWNQTIAPGGQAQFGFCANR
jgi:cellulase/cellobiase CelA1